MNNTRLFLLGICVFLMHSCRKPNITDDLLDGPVIFDPSLFNPEAYLVSAKYPNPTPEDLEKHVILTIHGYTASTFEWMEFSDWSADKPYRISHILLGGHGRDYFDFKASSWQDWRASIIEEYERLIELGYTKISLVGSSTGGTLILELITSSYFDTRLSPKNIFLIDAIVVPSNKLQSLINIVGPIIVYSEAEQLKGEEQFWYRFRPQETIKELNKVIIKVRKELEMGRKVPKDTYFKGFHSLYDPEASTTSSVLVFKGLKTSTGGPVAIELMDSEIHVFTRLSLRPNITPLQRSNQEHAFLQIANKLN